ncbi:MAG: AraC family transcriptional regulator [bacterium]|nr:AraC family transcriptional regulator [bacterium]
MTENNSVRQKLLFEGNTRVITCTTIGGFTKPYTPHYHSELEFHLICRGKFRYFIGDTSYNLHNNSLAIIHENEVHNCISAASGYAKKMLLIFSPKLLKNRSFALEIIDRLKTVHYLKLSEQQARAVEMAILEIAEEYRLKEQHWERAITDVIEKLLIVLDRARLNIDEPQTVEDPLIQEILGYLEKTFAEKTSLSDLAARFDVSPYILSRMFKQYVGMGFRKYLIHRRIVEAKCLLEQTNHKILTVAQAVGFDDLSTFNRDFKLLTGIPPSVYRKISP